MSDTRVLLGEAPSAEFATFAGGIRPAEPWQTIFPIVSIHADRSLRLIGTGFFIARSGIFVTAKHVLMDVVSAEMKQVAAISLLQLLPGDQFVLRPILRCVWHTQADVGVGVASPMTHGHTGELLENKLLVLTTTKYRVGTPVFTYAYPKSELLPGLVRAARIEPAFFDGCIEEYYPHGRDRVLLPGRTYRTSMHVHGGASGGPVFGPDGTVIGVNSTGYNGEPLSFASAIDDILSLYVTDIVTDGSDDPKDVSIVELASKRVIVFRPNTVGLRTIRVE